MKKKKSSNRSSKRKATARQKQIEALLGQIQLALCDICAEVSEVLSGAQGAIDEMIIYAFGVFHQASEKTGNDPNYVAFLGMQSAIHSFIHAQLKYVDHHSGGSLLIYHDSAARLMLLKMCLLKCDHLRKQWTGADPFPGRLIFEVEPFCAADFFWPEKGSPSHRLVKLCKNLKSCIRQLKRFERV